MDDAMGPRASVWAILEKHHQERFDAYMAAKDQQPLIICLTNTPGGDRPTVTGTILAGLPSCFDWPMWPVELAPHSRGRVEKYFATPSEVADALRTVGDEDQTAAALILSALCSKQACVSGEAAKRAARVLGAEAEEVGEYSITIRYRKASQLTDEEQVAVAALADTIESLTNSEEEELSCHDDDADQEDYFEDLDEEESDVEGSDERYGSLAAPHPSLWIAPVHRQRAEEVLGRTYDAIGLSFDTDLEQLVKTAVAEVAKYRRVAMPELRQGQSRRMKERRNALSPEERHNEAVRRWLAMTDEQKAAQLRQLRSSLADKPEGERKEIYRRAGEAISTTFMKKTQEERSAPALKRWKDTTLEQRRNHMAAANASRTPEQRGIAVSKAAARKTPEERSNSAKKAANSLTAEERKRRAQDGNDSLTKQQKKDRADKGVSKRAEVYKTRREEVKMAFEMARDYLNSLDVQTTGIDAMALLECRELLEETLGFAKSVKTSRRAKAFPQAHELLQLD